MGIGPKLMMTVVFIWVMGNLVSIMVDGDWLGPYDELLMSELTGYNPMQVQGSGVSTIVQLSWGFLSHGLPTMITWDFSYLTGGLVILRLLLITFISGPICWGVAMSFIHMGQGLLSGLLRWL